MVRDCVLPERSLVHCTPEKDRVSLNELAKRVYSQRQWDRFKWPFAHAAVARSSTSTSCRKLVFRPLFPPHGNCAGERKKVSCSRRLRGRVNYSPCTQEPGRSCNRELLPLCRSSHWGNDLCRATHKQVLCSWLQACAHCMRRRKNRRRPYFSCTIPSSTRSSCAPYYRVWSCTKCFARSTPALWVQGNI